MSYAGGNYYNPWSNGVSNNNQPAAAADFGNSWVNQAGRLPWSGNNAAGYVPEPAPPAGPTSTSQSAVTTPAPTLLPIAAAPTNAGADLSLQTPVASAAADLLSAAASATAATGASTTTASSSSSTKTATPSPVAPHQAGFIGNGARAAEISSGGLARGTLFAAIFIPIIAVAFICSLCLVCFLRRRRRVRMAAARGLQELHPESVEKLGNHQYHGVTGSNRGSTHSASYSRSLPPFGPGASLSRYSSASDAVSDRARHHQHGPLITVDGPSFSRPLDDNSNNNGNGTGNGVSSVNGASSGNGNGNDARSPITRTYSPPLPLQLPSQLSETNLSSLYGLGEGPSPFADPEDDDAVSDISEPGHRHPSHQQPPLSGTRPHKDSDSYSVVSDVSDAPARPTRFSHRRL